MSSYIYEFGPVLDAASLGAPCPAPPPVLPGVSPEVLSSFPRTIIIGGIDHHVVPTVVINGWIHHIIPTSDGSYEYSNQNISVFIPDISSA
uniref:Uncharacterized protein n=1 Tax=Pithovirus LCPAC101 TaxID=2506586 RepID=A0A481Z3M1_9VIRU|nr:MAG: hypothetical protein LCPAC101_03390 [Pithovirus LCPAC101]